MLTMSVVIPAYNRAQLVGRAIRSALANIEPGDEILVVDDASTDQTEAVVTAFGPPVRYIRVPHGVAGAARNRGIAEARGDLVAFLDSDDEWFAGKLRLQRQFLERRPDVLFAFGNFRSREDNGKEEPFFLKHWHKDVRPWDEILAPGEWYSTIAPLPGEWNDFRVHVGGMYLRELEADYIATTTVIVRRIEAGPALAFAEDLAISEDKACFARLAGRGPGAYFDVELSVQWGHTGPRLTDIKLEALVSSRLALIERIWEQDPVFVAHYAEQLQLARRQQYLKRAKWLLRKGRTAEARRDFELAGGGSITQQLLASVPTPVAQSVLAAVRFVKSRAALSW